MTLDSANTEEARTTGRQRSTLTDLGKVRRKMGEIELVTLQPQKSSVGRSDVSLMGEALGERRYDGAKKCGILRSEVLEPDKG